MNKFKLLISTIFIVLCSTGCKEDKEPKSRRQWINHPYEALRYPEYGFFKYSMSGHKIFSDDSDLSVRNAIMDNEYDSFEKISSDSVVKSKNKLEYVVCYGNHLNDVLATMTFYDNGYISMTDYNFNDYAFKLSETSTRNIFDVANNCLTTLENTSISQIDLAKEACVPENFISSYAKSGQKAIWSNGSYICEDSENTIFDFLKTINYKYDSQTTIDDFYSEFRFSDWKKDYAFKYYIEDYYFLLLGKELNSVTFGKMFFDIKKGQFMFNMSKYSISKTNGEKILNLSDYCAMKEKEKYEQK